MAKTTTETYSVCRPYWALLWRSQNQLDGYREHVMFENCRPLLFDTRREAREYREQKYGYLRSRPDLKAEPFGWRMPLPIKVQMKFDYRITR